MKNVLIVEDDYDIVELIDIHLQDISCNLKKVYNGRQGLEAALSETFDLIILDIMLPEMDGIEICRTLRAKNIKSPIVMLTAKAEEIDKVLGLEIGADDYITKPFSVREFIARIKALLRRSEMHAQSYTSASNHIISFKNLEIDREKKKVSLDGQRIDLSRKEFELLTLLASNPGKSYSRTRLLSLIWGYDFDGFEHTVNSHINRLRAKIESDMSKPEFILTSWGIGYRFNEEI
jgi:DNA-binding response OmpR family regulator